MKAFILACLFVLLTSCTSFAATVTAHLVWTADAPSTSYKIKRNVAGGAYAEVGTVAAPTVAFDNTGLALGSTYCWVVVGSNDLGDGVDSDPVCGSLIQPGKVGGVTVTFTLVP